MPWTTPELVEIKMDAEIGAYQPDDFGNDPLFAAPAGAPLDASTEPSDAE